MRVKYTLLAIVVLAVIAAPVLSSAQKLELTPYAGYRWTSQLTGTTISSSTGDEYENIDFKSGAFFGLWFDIDVAERLQLELVAEGFPSSVQGTDVATRQKTDAYDITLYYFQLGLLYEIIEAGVSKDLVKVRPFITGALGSTVFDAAGARSSEVKFSASFALGFKTMFNQRLGLRTQGRYMYTYMNASNDYFCTGDGTGTGEQCTIFPTSESLSQIDVSLGLIIAF